MCSNFMQNLFQTLLILTTLSKLHFSFKWAKKLMQTYMSKYLSRFKSSGLLCYANQSILTFIFSVKQSKKKITKKATVLSSLLTTWTGKMALFWKGLWNLWFNRSACRKSLLMVVTSGILQGYRLLNRPSRNMHTPLSQL